MPQPASPEPAAGVGGSLDGIERVLLFVAGGGLPSRETAVEYLNHRSALLASPLGRMLPGFLYQCGTIDRFRDFISLYDPDVELRREFVERMIARARSLGATEPTPEPAPRAATQSRSGASSTWVF